jgi:hypothetical protein
MRLTAASHQNGLLSIDLVSEIPQVMKPPRIKIKAAQVGETSERPAQIEATMAGLFQQMRGVGSSAPSLSTIGLWKGDE